MTTKSTFKNSFVLCFSLLLQKLLNLALVGYLENMVQIDFGHWKNMWLVWWFFRFIWWAVFGCFTWKIETQSWRCQIFSIVWSLWIVRIAILFKPYLAQDGLWELCFGVMHLFRSQWDWRGNLAPTLLFFLIFKDS